MLSSSWDFTPALPKCLLVHSHSMPKLCCLYWNIINCEQTQVMPQGPVLPVIPGCLPALRCSFQNKTFPRGNTPTWQVLFQLLFIELLENSAWRKGKSSSSFFPAQPLLPAHSSASCPWRTAGWGHSSSPLTPLCLLYSSTSMINWIQTFCCLLFFATGTANHLFHTWAQEVPHQESPCSRPLDTEQQEKVWSCYNFAAIGGKKKKKHFIKLQSNSGRQLCLDPLPKTGFMMMVKCTLSAQQTSLNLIPDMSYSYFDIFLKCADIHTRFNFI